MARAVAAAALRLAAVASRPAAILASSAAPVPSVSICSSASRCAAHIPWSSLLPVAAAAGLPRFYAAARGASSRQRKEEESESECGSEIDDFDSEDLDDLDDEELVFGDSSGDEKWNADDSD